MFARQRLLWACRQDRPVTSYRVALGSGGLGKTREGDQRTPLGTYALGRPRPSRRFARFIPIAYPTAEQRRDGYTGGSVGIHGPPAGGLDPLGAVSNWTDGCIAVDRMEDAEELAAWVLAQRVRSISIEE